MKILFSRCNEYYVSPGVRVSVGVGHGDDDKVEVVHVLRLAVVVVQQLVEGPGGDGVGDPLTGVDACNIKWLTATCVLTTFFL